MSVTNRRRGFTIVELLIVIVVVAILAAISIVAYSGIQQRARDARRLSDIQMINKAILSYYAVNGRYPQQTASPGVAGLEASTDSSNTFLEYLKNAGFLSSPPLDPLNDSNHFYGYFLYPATGVWESNGCDVSRGAYYILVVYQFESTTGAHPDSPGFRCASRNWQGSSSYQWVTGGYTN